MIVDKDIMRGLAYGYLYEKNNKGKMMPVLIQGHRLDEAAVDFCARRLPTPVRQRFSQGERVFNFIS